MPMEATVTKQAMSAEDIGDLVTTEESLVNIDKTDWIEVTKKVRKKAMFPSTSHKLLEGP